MGLILDQQVLLRLFICELAQEQLHECHQNRQDRENPGPPHHPIATDYRELLGDRERPKEDGAADRQDHTIVELEHFNALTIKPLVVLSVDFELLPVGLLLKGLFLRREIRSL